MMLSETTGDSSVLTCTTESKSGNNSAEKRTENERLSNRSANGSSAKVHSIMVSSPATSVLSPGPAKREWLASRGNSMAISFFIKSTTVSIELCVYAKRTKIPQLQRTDCRIVLNNERLKGGVGLLLHQHICNAQQLIIFKTACHQLNTEWHSVTVLSSRDRDSRVTSDIRLYGKDVFQIHHCWIR